MSLAQELNEMGNRDIPHFEYIQVRDLELGKKYKVLRLHKFEWKKTRAGKIGISVRVDGGSQFVLPDRFKGIADYLNINQPNNISTLYYTGNAGKRTPYIFHQPKNIYISYIGRGKRNAYLIHFYDEEKLIELGIDENVKKVEKIMDISNGIMIDCKKSRFKHGIAAHRYKNLEYKSLSQFLNAVRPNFIEQAKKHLNDCDRIEVNILFEGQFCHHRVFGSCDWEDDDPNHSDTELYDHVEHDDDMTERKKVNLKTEMNEILRTTDLNNWFYENINRTLRLEIADFMETSSDVWTLHDIKAMTISFNKSNV